MSRVKGSNLVRSSFFFGIASLLSTLSSLYEDKEDARCTMHDDDAHKKEEEEEGLAYISGMVLVKL